MERLLVLRNQRNARRFHCRAGMRLLVALICCGLTAAAQNSTQQKASESFSIPGHSFDGIRKREKQLYRDSIHPRRFPAISADREDRGHR